MPTYVYETCPTAGGEPQRFEVSQRMSDKPLTRHPDTGEPVRRIVSGGLGFVCGSGEGSSGAGGCTLPGCGHAHG